MNLLFAIILPYEILYKVYISTNFKKLYSVLFVLNVALLWNGNHLAGHKGNNSFERIISESNLECANSIIDIYTTNVFQQ